MSGDLKSFVSSLLLVFVVGSTVEGVQTEVLTSAGRKSKPTQNRRTLTTILKQSKGKGGFVPAGKNQLLKFKELLQATLRCDDPEKLKWRWKKLNWNLDAVPNLSGWVLSEVKSHRTGRGCYFFRKAEGAALVIQAPHRFHDLRTGIIARKLAGEDFVGAVAWNTVHRREGDLAHVERHHFNQFTETLAEYESDFLFLQLHGFSGKQKSEAVKSAKLIVSDGTRYPGRPARFLAIELKKALGREQVRLFPIEAKELGGTQNAQAKSLWEIGSTQFLHLEMNADFRMQITQNRSEYRRFEQVLRQLARKSSP